MDTSFNSIFKESRTIARAHLNAQSLLSLDFIISRATAFCELAYFSCTIFFFFIGCFYRDVCSS